MNWIYRVETTCDPYRIHAAQVSEQTGCGCRRESLSVAVFALVVLDALICRGARLEAEIEMSAEI